MTKSSFEWRIQCATATHTFRFISHPTLNGLILIMGLSELLLGCLAFFFYLATLELCDEYVKAKSQRRNLTIYEIHLIQKAAKQQQP